MSIVKRSLLGLAEKSIPWRKAFGGLFFSKPFLVTASRLEGMKITVEELFYIRSDVCIHPSTYI